MSDAIDRQAAYATALAMYVRCDTGNIEDYRDLMCESIMALPSAQPEIIRCKDCKHLFEDNKCPLRTWWTHTEDDFCSYAERRTDE